MSLICNICGKKVSAGEGQDTSYGFVCYDCYNARNFQLCVECGRRFPRDEMIEWHGLLYCRSDYFLVKARYERMLEEDRKKKADKEAKNRLAPPLASRPITVRSMTRTKLANEEISGLIGEISSSTSSRHREVEAHIKKIKKKEIMEEFGEETDDFVSVLRELENSVFAPMEAVGDTVFGSVSLSKKAKEKRKGEFSNLLSQLNSFVRGK